MGIGDSSLHADNEITRAANETISTAQRIPAAGSEHRRSATQRLISSCAHQPLPMGYTSSLKEIAEGSRRKLTLRVVQLYRLGDLLENRAHLIEDFRRRSEGDDESVFAMRQDVLRVR